MDPNGLKLCNCSASPGIAAGVSSTVPSSRICRTCFIESTRLASNVSFRVSSYVVRYMCQALGASDPAVVLSVAQKLATPEAFACAVPCCQQLGGWPLVLELLDDAKRSDRVDLVLYNACAGACAWPEALQVFADMERNGILMDTISYNSAISSCGKAGPLKPRVWKQPF